MQKFYEKYIFPSQHSYQNKDLRTIRANVIYMNDEDKTNNLRPILQVKSLKQDCELNMIYYQGNSQDLGLSFSFMLDLSDSLECNVYAIEYPTYGTYQSKSSNSILSQINDDSQLLYEYLTKQKNISPNNLSIFGRSIGTGPTSWLASKYPFSFVVLLSPFTSLKEITFLLRFLGKDFENKKNLFEGPSYSPILFLHGQEDKLINCSHSKALYDSYKQKFDSCDIQICKNMTHNEFDFKKDIVKHIQAFMIKINQQKNKNNQPFLNRFEGILQSIIPKGIEQQDPKLENSLTVQQELLLGFLY